MFIGIARKIGEVQMDGKINKQIDYQIYDGQIDRQIDRQINRQERDDGLGRGV